MAQQQNERSGIGALFALCIAGGAIWLGAEPYRRMPRAFGENAQTAALALAAFVCLLLLLPLLGRLLARAALFRKTHARIDEHLDSLMRRRSQLVQKDAYGRLKLEKWEKEIDYFIAHQIAPLLSNGEQAALSRNYTQIMDLIDADVQDAIEAQPEAAFHDAMTPSEFETLCAKTLRDAGWDARVTQQSRDQGVDVIAEKNRVRVVLQCKLYSRPVGNKSVQEAAAARLHEQADVAAVVTNNRYTPAAEQLAATTGVLLLHYRDLPRLGERIAT